METVVDQAVSNYWYQELVTQLEGKLTLKYLQIQDRPIQKVHNIWNAVHPYERDVKQVEEKKTRLVTGIYILLTNIAKFNETENLDHANYVTKKKTTCNTSFWTAKSFILLKLKGSSSSKLL